jgi:DNA-binding transcriptional regulator YiaG
MRKRTKTAQRWKSTRQRMLLSQTEFSLALGMHKRTVQGIERGEHPPSWPSQRAFREFVRRWTHNECKKNRVVRRAIARDAGPEWN